VSSNQDPKLHRRKVPSPACPYLVRYLPLPNRCWLKGEGAHGGQQEQALDWGQHSAPVELPAQALAIGHVQEDGDGVDTWGRTMHGTTVLACRERHSCVAAAGSWLRENRLTPSVNVNLGMEAGIHQTLACVSSLMLLLFMDFLLIAYLHTAACT
jgi:hypothetical protein